MKLALLLLLGLSTKTWAADESVSGCPDRVERHGTIQIQQNLSGSNVCFLSVSNYKTTGGVYRNYLFTGDGSLMVFNSYGWGDDSDSTGAREYFFFPRKTTEPTYYWNSEARRLEVTAVSGDQFYFDYETGEMVAASKGKVTVAPEVRPDNKGGVEISQYQGLMLDIGFSIGRAPSSSSSSYSVFRDAKAASCKIKNNLLFTYKSSGDVYFRYNDTNLAAFLKRNCSKLQF
jgi:hypothetical protein